MKALASFGAKAHLFEVTPSEAQSWLAIGEGLEWPTFDTDEALGRQLVFVDDLWQDLPGEFRSCSFDGDINGPVTSDGRVPGARVYRTVALDLLEEAVKDDGARDWVQDKDLVPMVAELLAWRRLAATDGRTTRALESTRRIRRDASYGLARVTIPE